MRYVEARWNDFNRDETYRIYVTTSLKLAPQSKFLNNDYWDLVDMKEPDNRTGDEIASDIIERAGLKFK